MQWVDMGGQRTGVSLGVAPASSWVSGESHQPAAVSRSLAASERARGSGSTQQVCEANATACRSAGGRADCRRASALASTVDLGRVHGVLGRIHDYQRRHRPGVNRHRSRARTGPAPCTWLTALWFRGGRSGLRAGRRPPASRSLPLRLPPEPSPRQRAGDAACPGARERSRRGTG